MTIIQKPSMGRIVLFYGGGFIYESPAIVRRVVDGGRHVDLVVFTAKGVMYEEDVAYDADRLSPRGWRWPPRETEQIDLLPTR